MTMAYDGHDRQVQWVFPSPTTAGQVNAADYEAYGYDAVSNRTSFRKRDGSTLTYTYDNLNRVIVKTVPSRAGLAATHSRSVYTGYDLRNLPLYTRFDNASGEGVTMAYDGFGQLTSTTMVMDGVTRSMEYQYDAAENRTRLTYPGEVYFSYEYDPAGRMTTVRENGSAVLASITYDGLGQRQSSTSTYGDAVGYGYDAASRLTSLTHGFIASTGNVAFGFGYNPASQLSSQTRDNDIYAWTAHYNVNRGYTTNGLNQYTSAGSAAFTYDANGNLTSDGGTTYTYDIENRLVAATGAKTASLRYDPLGRLYETSGGSAGITRFLYDGDELVAEFGAGGGILRRYVHGASADDPIVWYEAGQSWPQGLRRPHVNHQGSVISYADGNGALISINSYDEYGIPAVTNLGRFQYTGQAWIPELGMYYYKARVYSPTLGRFMQTDPIGYKDQVNLYAYVGNDPINEVDTDGEQRRPILVPSSGPNVPRTLPEILRDQQYRARVSEIGAVSPRLNRYLPTFVGPPSSNDVRVATGISRATNIIRPGSTNSSPATSASNQSAVDRVRSVLGRASLDGVTGKGTFHFQAAGGLNGQAAAMSTLGPNGTLNFGGGLTATVGAYAQATSTGGPSIQITFRQSGPVTGSNIQDPIVARVKIRF